MTRKQCNECGKPKLLNDFYRNASAADGRHTKCKACIGEAQALYRTRNQAKIKARRVAYRDQARENAVRWYAENPEYRRSYRERNRDVLDAQACEWARENPERHRFNSSQRRARLKTNAEWDREAALEYTLIISRDPCVYCGGTTTETDHIVPIANGGSGAWDNLAPTCLTCNRSKQTKSVLGFLLHRAAVVTLHNHQ